MGLGIIPVLLDIVDGIGADSSISNRHFLEIGVIAVPLVIGATVGLLCGRGLRRINEIPAPSGTTDENTDSPLDNNHTDIAVPLEPAVVPEEPEPVIEPDIDPATFSRPNMSMLTNHVSPSGRSSREGFLRNSAIIFSVHLFVTLGFTWVSYLFMPSMPDVVVPIVVYSILLFVSMPLWLFQVSKRLHDLGIPGWRLVELFIPFWNIWILVKLCLIKGSNKTNDYGPRFVALEDRLNGVVLLTAMLLSPILYVMVDDLSVVDGRDSGECLAASDLNAGTKYEMVSCDDERWNYMVTGSFTITKEDWPYGAFPMEDTFHVIDKTNCVHKLIGDYHLYPSAQTWQEGDRLVVGLMRRSFNYSVSRDHTVALRVLRNSKRELQQLCGREITGGLNLYGGVIEPVFDHAVEPLWKLLITILPLPDRPDGRFR